MSNFLSRLLGLDNEQDRSWRGNPAVSSNGPDGPRPQGILATQPPQNQPAPIGQAALSSANVNPILATLAQRNQNPQPQFAGMTQPPMAPQAPAPETAPQVPSQGLPGALSEAMRPRPRPQAQPQAQAPVAPAPAAPVAPQAPAQYNPVNHPPDRNISATPRPAGSGARAVFQHYVSQGMPAHQAAAVVGNMMQESGPDLNPNAFNKSENAVGIMQWRGDRLENLKKFAASRGTSPNDLMTQADFALWERDNTEKGGWSKVGGAKTVEEAAQLFDQHVERSSGEHRNQRVAFAKSLLDGGDAGALMGVSGSGEGVLSATNTGGPLDDPRDGYREGYDWRDPNDGQGNSLWDKFNNFTHKGDNAEKLLAIGSGLLSGKNWNEGLALASDGLLSVNDQTQSEEFASEQADLDEDYRNRALDQKTADDAGRWFSSGNVELEDGSVVEGFTTDSRPGLFDAQGQPISGVQVTRSNAGGDKGQGSFKNAVDEQEELTHDRQSIESFDKLITFMDTAPQGVNKLADEIGIYWKTLIGSGLTPEEIQLKASQGALQGQLGQIRTEVVGPGVLTEQDAARILAAMGGDMKSIASNPEVLKQRLSDLRKKQLQSFGQRRLQYETMRQNNPQLNYIEVPDYAPQGALTGVTGAAPDATIEEILKRNGV